MDGRIIELPRDEWAVSRELTSYCFGDYGAFVDWVFARRADHVYAIKESGKLVAQVIDTRVPLSVRGKAVAGCLISHVATEPGYRSRGYMARLLPETMRVQRDEGVALASLYPFDYEYYERFGFAACGEIAQINIPLRLLPPYKPIGILARTQSEGADAAALTDCYLAAMAGRSGYTVRDARLTGDRLAEVYAADGAYAVTLRPHMESSAISGYMLYHFDGRAIVADEFVATDAAARADLLAYLASHASTHDMARIGVSADDPMRFSIPARKGYVSLEPWGMFRVLDLARLASGMECGTGEITLRVEDRQLPWNNGIWRFASDGGRLDVSRSNADGSPVVSANEITRVLMGDIRAARIPQHARAAVESLFPPCEVWIQEQY